MNHKTSLWILIILLLLTGCTSLKIWLDSSGIEDVADMILRDYQNESPQELTSFLNHPDSFSHDRRLAENQVTVGELSQWRLDNVAIQRKITFPSPIKRKNGENDKAIFYLYSQHRLEGQKVILWIPGFGVSDFAFRFIKTFFINELDADYSVLFYNIPAHLNRIEDGREMGEGLFTGNNQKNLELIANVRYEIDAALNYLEGEKVSSISGWGGSIGAAFLWLASESFHFEHMTLMIPIVDWTTLIFHDRMGKVVERMNRAGISNEMIKQAYRNVSPFYIPTKTDPDKIQILYARFDQFTPKTKILEFSQKWKIKKVNGYDESHASILINGQIYKDNQLFLKELPHFVKE